MSDSLRPHGLQHARLPCPSPSPGVCSDSCPLSWWCHPTILSSVEPFSSCLQSLPASGSFLMSRLFGSGGQSIGASASVLPMNIHDWFPLGLTGWSSCSPMDSQESSPTPQLKSINSSALSFLYGPTHIHTWLLEKTIALTRWTFVSKVMLLLFGMLSRLVIAFLPISKHLLTSWLQSPSAVILKPKKIKSVTVFIVSPSICHDVMGPDAMIFIFWMLSFKPAFVLSSFIVHGILQARILVAFSLFRGSSQPRDWTQVSCIAGRFFTSWATREAPFIIREIQI